MLPETQTIPVEAKVVSGIDAALTQWQTNLDQMEAETAQLAGSGEFPDWWYEGNPNRHELTQQIREGVDQNPALVSKYAELYTQQTAIEQTILDRAAYEHPINQVIYGLGEDVVGRALAAEEADGPLHRGILENLQMRVETDGFYGSEMDVLKESYGLESLTELLGVGGDGFSDEVARFMRTEKAVRKMFAADAKIEDDAPWPEKQEHAREWMSLALVAAAGISQEEAAEYSFSASRRYAPELILKVVEKFDHFGADRIRMISKFTNIRGLEGYTAEQLERMEDLATHPENFAKKMEGHDVQVALINRAGDHNGVLEGVAATLDDENGRTLFFEVDGMSDIYRSASRLHRTGIKPSTLIFAAHSAPGEFMISDDRDPKLRRRGVATALGYDIVARASDKAGQNLEERIYSIQDMKGFQRLASDYMRPSRGLDDDPQDIGRKKIVFWACHAGAEVSGNDTESEHRAATTQESVISSVAKDLATAEAVGDVDIYGANVPIQMERTGSGIIYTGSPDQGLERKHVEATRMRVHSGSVTKEMVDEVRLRKTA